MDILVDLDSTVTDFLGACIEAYTAETGDTSITKDHVIVWDYKFPNGKTCYHYFKVPGFFRNLNPLPGAIESLKKLKDAGHNICIVSSATLDNGPEEKFKWIDENLPFLTRKDVYFAAQKGRIYGDILIDDYHKNAEEWLGIWPEGKVFTLAYAYNDFPVFQLRASNWDEIYQAIMDLGD